METYIQVSFVTNALALGAYVLLLCSEDYPRKVQRTVASDVIGLVSVIVLMIWAAKLLNWL